MPACQARSQVTGHRSLIQPAGPYPWLDSPPVLPSWTPGARMEELSGSSTTLPHPLEFRSWGFLNGLQKGSLVRISHPLCGQHHEAKCSTWLPSLLN